MSTKRCWPWSRDEIQKNNTATVNVVASDTSSQNNAERAESRQGLQRRLHSSQIFMIALSGIIGGIIIFSTMGQFLHTAGPAGLFTAIAIVGITAIAVMEGLGELVVQWPVSNAMVRYVEVFVDEDLATVVGLVYWYTYSSVIATMVMGATSLSQYWKLPSPEYIGIFYIACPLVMIAINWIGVFWYGVIETLGGIFKLVIVLMGALFLIVEGTIRHGSYCANLGYQHDPEIALNSASATIMIIPFLTYGFLGVEIISVTAFEAKNPRTSLKHSARLIAPTILALFLLCGIGEAYNLAWYARDLPAFVPRDQPCQGSNVTIPQNNTRHYSMLVIETNNAGWPRLAGFFNACLIFSCLSAGNTALYVASRVLYGLAVENRTLPKVYVQWLAKLNRFDVPMWSIVVSGFSWIWAPFLQKPIPYSEDSVISVFMTIGSVGTVLVWAAQCLAFIFYYLWLRKHKSDLETLRRQDPQYWAKYDRWMHKNPDRYYSLLSEGQPFIAIFGLISCLLIVVVFSSATLWNHHFTAEKFFVAYGGPILCLIIWTGLKVFRKNRSPPLKLEKNVSELIKIISNFERDLYLREEDMPLRPTRMPTLNMPPQDDGARLPLTEQSELESQGRIVGQAQNDAITQIRANPPGDVPATNDPGQLTLGDETSPAAR